MTTDTRNRRGAEAIREKIIASRDRFWRPLDLDLKASTAYHLLGDLARRGELRHVRRGLYWRGTKTPLGMAPPRPEAVLGEVAPGKGFGPAGLTAANMLRLSTQIPRISEYAVPSRPPTGIAIVKLVSREARTARATSKLRPLEVAILEVLERWTDVIETTPDEAQATIERMLTSKEVSPERLVRASRTEPSIVRTRLRQLLEGSGLVALARQVPGTADRSTVSAA